MLDKGIETTNLTTLLEYTQSEASASTEEWLRPIALYIQMILLLVAFIFGYNILDQLQKEDKEFESLISSKILDHITENPNDKDIQAHKWMRYRKQVSDLSLTSSQDLRGPLIGLPLSPNKIDLKNQIPVFKKQSDPFTKQHSFQHISKEDFNHIEMFLERPKNQQDRSNKYQNMKMKSNITKAQVNEALEAI